MKISTRILYRTIEISEPQIDDVYNIEQCEDTKRFYIVSDNGYNGYEGDGHKTLESAIKHCKKMIKDYFVNRCEPNPKGW